MDELQSEIQDQQQHIHDLEDELKKLSAKFTVLSADYYLNNFPSSQDFIKKSRFLTRFSVPHYDSPPTTCNVGELIESGGILKICSAVNTWTTVGAQV